jgi:TolA-binding protein
MTEVEQDVPVDPAFARVQPRWSGARTERNLAATFDRIERARRVRRAGAVVVGVAGAAAIALLAVPRARHAGAGGEPVAARAPVVTAPPVASAAVEPAPLAEVGGAQAGVSTPARPARVVEVSRVDFKIASARALFRKQVARREYAAAYRSLVAAPEVADTSAEGLMLAADAARLSGHAAESVPYFRRLLREHAGDARAPVGAFTLGRILLAELERPAEAAEAFALARRLAPAGPLAPDALAREVEAAARAGDRARARARALEYAARYPDGPRAADVRRAGGLE